MDCMKIPQRQQVRAGSRFDQNLPRMVRWKRLHRRSRRDQATGQNHQPPPSGRNRLATCFDQYSQVNRPALPVCSCTSHDAIGPWSTTAWQVKSPTKPEQTEFGLAPRNQLPKPTMTLCSDDKVAQTTSPVAPLLQKPNGWHQP